MFVCLFVCLSIYCYEFRDEFRVLLVSQLTPEEGNEYYFGENGCLPDSDNFYILTIPPDESEQEEKEEKEEEEEEEQRK